MRNLLHSVIPKWVIYPICPFLSVGIDEIFHFFRCSVGNLVWNSSAIGGYSLITSIQLSLSTWNKLRFNNPRNRFRNDFFLFRSLSSNPHRLVGSQTTRPSSPPYDPLWSLLFEQEDFRTRTRIIRSTSLCTSRSKREQSSDEKGERVGCTFGETTCHVRVL